ncbi:MAG: pyrroline-5-carboxylate reductase [Candidatus Scalindua sp. AMX11]|nr:MAG: pyrroline-5-carboxylate reductase [Candidatus Scalindua sp.]NOG85538.1 pyrroline-5-carboxylate reductase [Planctomycetota bacterium]RZV90214.1 MAG: pyrroline-5-carboxylate reductase [Candidatus Scalindua sp. SCAELEC01]TDE64999.1 MAG: pyrroline-5-carboxylate reductase [Candidatus Scalindua sp. AMX11]GJQ59566.1 MAG: pyrroline-5-carboxylate reductase [Candidatus Scalindua sp.]
MRKERIGFIGGGKMAEALIKGLLSAQISTNDKIEASDIDRDRCQILEKATGIKTFLENDKVVSNSDVLFLAIKPNLMGNILEELKEVITPRHLVVSIAAGIPTCFIESNLNPQCRIIRVMPNTPCLVGETAAGYSLGMHATEDDGMFVSEVFNTVGKGYRVEEPLLDAVTGLSGSGPAFIYIVIEALSDGGVKMGLPRSTATALAAQTVLGAAKMVLESGRHAAELKDFVTSPGGTTIEGVHKLEKNGIRNALIEAVEAATKKSKKLGKSFSKQRKEYNE